QPEGVAVAVLPHDLVREWLAGQEEELLLFREVRQRQADVRQEGTRQHLHAFARDQLLGRAHRVTGVGVVVARDQLQLAAVHSACRIDLFDREFHALLVGLEEGRLRLVAVDLADADRLLRLRVGGRAPQGDCGRHHRRCGLQLVPLHVHRRSWLWVGRAYRRPSSPLISWACSPPMRASGLPLAVTTTATTISLARGASATRASIASKWLRTNAASLCPSGTSIAVPRPPRFLLEGTSAAPFSTALR